MYMKIKGDWYEVNPKGWLDGIKVKDLDPDMVKKALNSPNRKDPLRKGVDVKSIGSRRKTSTDKNIIAAYTKALSPGANKAAYNAAKAAWKTTKAKAMTSFKDLVSDLGAGKITKNQFLNRSRSIFKSAYEDAYRLGTDASGLRFMDIPDEDLRWLQRVRSYEYKFLDNFADDIVAGRGSMDYSHRAEMYMDTIDSVFDAARVDAYPNEGTSVWWELSTADNCGDCIDLAMNSPYTPDTLPTTPRAGATKCLSNCMCRLRIRYERPEQIVFDFQRIAIAALIGLGLAQMNKIVNREDAIDWDALDSTVTALVELQMSKDKVEDVESRTYLKREALDLLESSSKMLPDWLDLFSEEMFILHRVGVMALEYAGKGGGWYGKT